MADEKIIFSMNGVGKVLPNSNKVILKDIYLSFFYGAKIGIIGLNGSGKSTLMKIIAGVEKSYQGEVVWAPGYSVGYLEQEPQMDPDKTVIEVVKEGVQEVADLLKEYEEINMKFAEPMSDEEMNALIERQGEVTEKISAVHFKKEDVKSVIVTQVPSLVNDEKDKSEAPSTHKEQEDIDQKGHQFLKADEIYAEQIALACYRHFKKKFSFHWTLAWVLEEIQQIAPLEQRLPEAYEAAIAMIERRARKHH